MAAEHIIMMRHLGYQQTCTPEYRYSALASDAHVNGSTWFCELVAPKASLCIPDTEDSEESWLDGENFWGMSKLN